MRVIVDKKKVIDVFTKCYPFIESLNQEERSRLVNAMVALYKTDGLVLHRKLKFVCRLMKRGKV